MEVNYVLLLARCIMSSLQFKMESDDILQFLDINLLFYLQRKVVSTLPSLLPEPAVTAGLTAKQSELVSWIVKSTKTKLHSLDLKQVSTYVLFVLQYHCGDKTVWYQQGTKTRAKVYNLLFMDMDKGTNVPQSPFYHGNRLSSQQPLTTIATAYHHSNHSPP